MLLIGQIKIWTQTGGSTISGKGVACRESVLCPLVKYFYRPFQDGTSFVDHLCKFVMLSGLFIAAFGSTTDLLALVCDV